jgi:hypothetical protein
MHASVSDTRLARMHIANITTLDAPESYSEMLSTLSEIEVTTNSSLRHIERVQELLAKAIHDTRPLLTHLTPAFDESKELVLWHGTRNASLALLLGSDPQMSRGAYGTGFYLSPQLGKVDQYTERRNDTEPYTHVVAYRFIPEMITINPHLDWAKQLQAETQGETSIITVDRKGQNDLRYVEVIARRTYMYPFAVLEYDLYVERRGLPPPTQPM